ncbi:cell wall-binding repeat-containing protein [Clostridium botulinum]|nr:cell wall-binding repeat-containing protein [Clostridium botulinum]
MKKTSKALASTAALCLVLSTSSAFAAENTTVAPERLAGANRVDTAIKIAEKSFNETWKGSGKAILSAAADANLVDSLAVAPLSYQLKAPILLNDAKDTINAETLKALKDNKVNTVYIATGEGVISNKAKAQLEKEGIHVERLGGKNRYETAKNILDTFKKNGGEAKNVALVSGTGLADALSVAPQAAKTGMPIILTNGKDAVAANLAEVAKAADKVYAIGGNGVISDALVQQLKADRVSGQSRYETNAAVIKKFAGDKEFSKIYLGNGQNAHLVDSLTGSVLAAQSGSPIVLADKNLSDATKDALKGKVSNKTGVVALGGEAVVSNEVVKETSDIANITPEYIAADKAVKAYEDAKIGTAEEITAAKALKAPAVKAVEAVKDASQKSALEARIAAKDKAIKDAEAKMEVSVESIEATNLNQVKVVFTSPVDSDSAEDVTNYEIGGKKLTKDENPDTDAIGVLQDDDRTVILTLADVQNQHDEVTVKVKKGILSEDKTKNIKEYEKDVTFKDLVEPKVSKVSVRGNNKLVVEFSEAIFVSNVSDEKAAAQRLAKEFEVNGQSIDGMGLNENSKVKDSLISGGNAYVNKVEFYFDSALDSGKNELKVLEGERDDILCDVAGFTIKEAKLDFNVDKVNSKPEVKSVKGGTDGKIYIDFDRPMDTETALEKSNYELNNKELPDDAIIELKKDDTQVKIKNVSDKIKTGSNTIEIKDKVEDAYGNKVDDNTRISFDADKDEEKPEVLGVESIDAETIRVRFNEDVKYSNATNKSNYELKDSNGIDITNSDIEDVVATNGTKDDTNVYDIKMYSAKKLTGAKYTLKVKNIADTSDNVMDDYETKFKGADDQAPKVDGVSKNKDEKNKVIIRFSERMDRSSVRNSDNYKFIDNSDSDKIKDLPSKTTISVASDDKTVTIEFPDAYKDKVGGIIVKSDVKDLAGNKMDADCTNTDMKSNLEVSYVDKSFKAKRNGDNVEVELQFDAALDTVDVNKFTFGDKKITPSSRTISGDKVTFKFNDKEKDGENKAEEIKKLGANLTVSFTDDAATDKAGQNVKSEKNIKVYDYFIAPELDPKEEDDYVDNEDWKVAVNKNEATITISFDTEIADLGKAYRDDFTFMADKTGNELDVKDDTIVDKNTIKYTFKDINQLKNVKAITIKADKDNIDVRTNKDEANNDQKYKPTNDDINGWKLKIGDETTKAVEKVVEEKEAVKAINEAKVEEMEKAITDNATVLGLDVDGDYDKLVEKTPVYNALVGNKFADKDAVQKAFNKAVADQKQVEADAEDAAQAKVEAQNGLKAKIAEVATVEKDKIEGKESGNQVEGSKAKLDEAKAAAQKVLDNQSSTTQQLKDATNALNTAIETYKASVVE